MSVEDRLARLERENRRLKVTGLLLLLAAASVFVMGQVRPPGPVDTTGLNIRDGSNRIVASLLADQEGTPWLIMSDKSGYGRIVLRVAPDSSASVTVWGHTDQPTGTVPSAAKAGLSMSAGRSTPAMRIWDSAERDRIMVGLGRSDESPLLFTFNEQGSGTPIGP
jgi:hypothetical protein